ncbi:MAG: VOC family protein [SAR202 cluster bacterium]|nr:VOC family protein [SAR202 cluster bacterium]
MAQYKGLSHIHIAVEDLKRSIKFYERAFGLKEQFWDGPSMVFLSTPGGSDLITLRQAEKGEAVGPGGVGHFGFGLKDKSKLDEAVADVVKAGGKLVQRGEHQPGHPYAYVKDPDGYLIEL